LISHFVLVALVTQQVTAPAGFPQIECAAHRLTAPAQPLLPSIRFACCAAQLTYAPWLVAPAQLQFAATAARALAMSVLSGSIVGRHLA
jgi:hypothetical protein